MSTDDDFDANEFDASLNESRVQGLFAEALRAPDPQRWVRTRIEDALNKLERPDRSPALVEEAKRQLFEIEAMLIRAIHDGKGKAR